MSYKSVKALLQECQIRLPHRSANQSVAQKCQARVSRQGILQECCAMASSKSVLPECQISVLNQGIPQVCLVENVHVLFLSINTIRVSIRFPGLHHFPSSTAAGRVAAEETANPWGMKPSSSTWSSSFEVMGWVGWMWKCLACCLIPLMLRGVLVGEGESKLSST